MYSNYEIIKTSKCAMWGHDHTLKVLEKNQVTAPLERVSKPLINCVMEVNLRLDASKVKWCA